ncbi:ABC transporter permease [Litorilinea aerophila]|uniref:ABC transporter permease n=1 Tax=Litorilinea aerophila TaxID=1204385 RepID=A0A540VCW8_9CHLR|nr:ABC transporter permease [Litorilinea aerophila]MCC9077635.1 ABC transporter permease [Litorilinea aerophila]OUC08505.1 ABC transporter permease [Litorilinea aerophila]GIV79757.1 MAG: ABC transporter permease [Litorilinea sp.]
MTLFKEYILPRLVQWILVIFIGVTVTFLIPRLSPVNPVDQALGRMTAFQTLSPEATLELRQSLLDLYGLEGSLLDQYLNFWKRVLRADLGPSFTSFPMTVNAIIGNAIWWTVGLLGTTVVLSWILGVILGGLAGYFRNRWWSQLLENTLIIIYPIPYYIVAFVLLMIFAYYFPIFPLVGGARGTPSFSWSYLSSLLEHAFLPALSIILGATAFRFIMSKALASTEVSSDYVQYAEMASLPRRRILFSYVLRNTMLPQVTDLGLSLGAIFEGALITEFVFGYPGLGSALYVAIVSADYNLIMGIALLSIFGIATASLLVDLTYPLLDPRVRYR